MNVVVFLFVATSFSILAESTTKYEKFSSKHVRGPVDSAAAMKHMHNAIAMSRPQYNQTGVIETVAGQLGGYHGDKYNGDGGQATAAYLSGPRGISLDKNAISISISDSSSKGRNLNIQFFWPFHRYRLRCIDDLNETTMYKVYLWCYLDHLLRKMK